MSAINDSGENEFAFEESNIVGISEIAQTKRIRKYSNQSKRKGSLKKRLRRINTLHFYNTDLTIQRNNFIITFKHRIPWYRLSVYKTTSDSFGFSYFSELIPCQRKYGFDKI